MNTFKAGVQYDDFTGTVAADVSDNVALLRHLQGAGVARENEQLVAVRVASGENQGVEVEEVAVVAYLHETDRFTSNPLKVRAAETRMSPGKLLSFYKRFDLVLVRKGTYVEDAEVEGPHY